MNEEITQTFGQEWCLTYTDPVNSELIWMPFPDKSTWLVLCEVQELSYYDEHGRFTGEMLIVRTPLNKYELNIADMETENEQI